METAGAEYLFSGGGVYRRSKPEQDLKQQKEDLLICFSVIFLIFTADGTGPALRHRGQGPAGAGVRHRDFDVLESADRP